MFWKCGCCVFCGFCVFCCTKKSRWNSETIPKRRWMRFNLSWWLQCANPWRQHSNRRIACVDFCRKSNALPKSRPGRIRIFRFLQELFTFAHTLPNSANSMKSPVRERNIGLYAQLSHDYAMLYKTFRFFTPLLLECFQQGPSQVGLRCQIVIWKKTLKGTYSLVVQSPQIYANCRFYATYAQNCFHVCILCVFHKAGSHVAGATAWAVDSELPSQAGISLGTCNVTSFEKISKNVRQMSRFTQNTCKRLKTCNEFGLKSRMNSVYPLLNMSHICVSLRHVVFSHGTLWHCRLIFTKNELLWLLVALVTVLRILCTRLARPRVRDEKMRMTRVFS